MLSLTLAFALSAPPVPAAVVPPAEARDGDPKVWLKVGESATAGTLTLTVRSVNVDLKAGMPGLNVYVKNSGTAAVAVRGWTNSRKESGRARLRDSNGHDLFPCAIEPSRRSADVLLLSRLLEPKEDALEVMFFAAPDRFDGKASHYLTLPLANLGGEGVAGWAIHGQEFIEGEKKANPAKKR